MQNTVSLFGIHAEAGPAFSFMISCLGAFFKGESNGLAGLGRAVAYTGVVAEGRTFHLSERAKGTHAHMWTRKFACRNTIGQIARGERVGRRLKEDCEYGLISVAQRGQD